MLALTFSGRAVLRACFFRCFLGMSVYCIQYGTSHDLYCLLKSLLYYNLKGANAVGYTGKYLQHMLQWWHIMYTHYDFSPYFNTVYPGNAVYDFCKQAYESGNDIFCAFDVSSECIISLTILYNYLWWYSISFSPKFNTVTLGAWNWASRRLLPLVGLRRLSFDTLWQNWCAQSQHVG